MDVVKSSRDVSADNYVPFVGVGLFILTVGLGFIFKRPIRSSRHADESNKTNTRRQEPDYSGDRSTDRQQAGTDSMTISTTKTNPNDILSRDHHHGNEVDTLNREGTTSVPLSVNYHFTRQCNYQCGFCFHTAKTSAVLPMEEAKRGLCRLKESGTFTSREPQLCMV